MHGSERRQDTEQGVFDLSSILVSTRFVFILDGGGGDAVRQGILFEVGAGEVNGSSTLAHDECVQRDRNEVELGSMSLQIGRDLTLGETALQPVLLVLYITII